MKFINDSDFYSEKYKYLFEYISECQEKYIFKNEFITAIDISREKPITEINGIKVNSVIDKNEIHPLIFIYDKYTNSFVPTSYILRFSDEEFNSETGEFNFIENKYYNLTSRIFLVNKDHIMIKKLMMDKSL